MMFYVNILGKVIHQSSKYITAEVIILLLLRHIANLSSLAYYHKSIFIDIISHLDRDFINQHPQQLRTAIKFSIYSFIHFS